LADRLAQVLAVVYLFFNEGYLASSGRQPARRDLAAQAVALTRTLHRLMPREPEVLGLLALLLLHESRAAARFDGWGRLIRLKDQDRSRWNGDLAAEATALLDRAMAMRRAGPYQVQAAIAALPSSMQSHVRWWIADPTGVPHLVPGSSATQWYWGSGYDISTASPGF